MIPRFRPTNKRSLFSNYHRDVVSNPLRLVRFGAQPHAFVHSDADVAGGKRWQPDSWATSACTRSSEPTHSSRAFTSLFDGGGGMKAERYIPEAYALLRVVFAFLYMCHGLQKFGLLDDRSPVPLTSLLGVAGVIEVTAGPLLIVGLLTRAAAFVVSGQMAAAYFISHQPDGFWPIQNNGELAALYCFAFLYVFARGAGRYSLDHARGVRAMSPDRSSMAAIP